MKKFLVLTIMMFTLVANTFASSVNINVNGKNIPNGGIIVDGKTYVSVRNVFESLGYTVDYDADSKTVSLSSYARGIFIYNNINYIRINGSNIPIDDCAKIINNKFMLPLRAVGEALAYNVDWNAETKTASITNRTSNQFGTSDIKTKNNKKFINSVKYTITRHDHSKRNNDGYTNLQLFYDEVNISDEYDSCSKINDSIKSHYNTFLTSNIPEAQSMYDLYSDLGGVFVDSFEASVTNNSNGIFSIRLMNPACFGGVDTNNFYCFNYDLNTGKQLELSDVFSISGNELTNYLHSCVKEYIEGRPDDFPDDALERADELLNDNTFLTSKFYVKNNSIFLCFDKYELTTGALGNITIECPIK